MHLNEKGKGRASFAVSRCSRPPKKTLNELNTTINMLHQCFSFIVIAAISYFGFVTNVDAQLLPYRRMAKAAASDENLLSQTRNQAIELKWKANLFAAQGLKGLQLKTFVLMQRGFVDSQEQQNKIRSVSNSMSLRSLDFYLPVRNKTFTGERG